MLRQITWDEDGMSDPDDRFERRLVEETSKVRVELAGVEVRLTDRIGQTEGTLRREISGVEGTLRKEISGVEVRLTERLGQSETTLRDQIRSLEVRLSDGLTAVDVRMGTLRFDLLKWSFLFWIGQVAVMTAIISALLPR